MSTVNDNPINDWNSIGRIFQINTSSQGGLPKLARLQAEVTTLGLEGDKFARPEFHGGPNQALCLYSLENIMGLVAEGHPVFPGALGENLTLIDVYWRQMEPGARLRLGREVLIEITSYTPPCEAIIPFFKDGNFKRMSNRRFPGWARVYAKVLQTGTIRVGDRVCVE